MSNEQMKDADAGRLELGVRPIAWAHRYSPRGLLHTLRDNQQDSEDDAAIVGGSAHAVALYDEAAIDAAVAAERERCLPAWLRAALLRIGAAGLQRESDYSVSYGDAAQFIAVLED